MPQIIALLLTLLLASPAQAQFTIPNVADAFHTSQAQIDKVDLDIIVAGINGTGVVSGCAVTAQGSPNMTVAVEAGTVRVGQNVVDVTAGNATITTANGTNPRFDLIVVNNSGTKSVTAGTAAAAPSFPAIPANSVVLAAVYVPASDTTIASNQIVDKRVLINNTVATRRLNTQHTVSSSTGTEVTGLQHSLTAGTYTFTYYLITQTANTTVGKAFGINYTGTAVSLTAWLRYADTGTAASTGIADADTAGIAEEIHGIFATRTESTTAPDLGPLTNHAASATNTMMVLEGVIVVSDAGDLELWTNSDAATQTSVEVGSSVIVMKTAD